MSVYPRRDGIYVYDFECQRLRFYGSTGVRGRRAAERIEAAKREEARQHVATIQAQRTGPMSVNVAFDRFWSDVGDRYTGTYRKTVWAGLTWMADRLGANTLLRDIGPNRVTELIAARRASNVTNATVNRTVTELLRRVLRRAERHWEQKVQPVEWRAMILPEPRERVRELRDHEEETLTAGMRADYLPAIAFARISGCRRREVVGLTWTDIDWQARTITIRGKGDKVRTLPLSDALRAILAPLRGHHAKAVFTYVCQATRPAQGGCRALFAGVRYPMTYEGLKSAWRRFGPASLGIADFRFHDLRHTAGTRLLRETGNLKLVQKLLGHETIATTTKYAHADDHDLRRGMDAVEKSRKKSRTATKAATK